MSFAEFDSEIIKMIYESCDWDYERTHKALIEMQGPSNEALSSIQN